MSHFTVLVATKPGQDLAEQLAPFDENTEVDPRDDEETDPRSPQEWAAKCAVNTDPKAHGGWRAFTDEERADFARVAALDPDNPDQAAELLTWYHGDPGRWRRREDGPYVTITTYNPQSKWDWWTIGGRWSGSLRTRSGDKVDSGRKGDLDLAGMMDEARTAARVKLGRYRQIIAESGPLPSTDWRGLSVASEEFKQRRDAYWAHPAVKRVGGFDSELHLDFNDLAHIEQSPEGWVESEAAQAIVGHAVLTHDGTWMEQGEMGWFGTSNTTVHSRIGYLEAAPAYIASLDDDVVLTMIDCHI